MFQQDVSNLLTLLEHRIEFSAGKCVLSGIGTKIFFDRDRDRDQKRLVSLMSRFDTTLALFILIETESGEEISLSGCHSIPVSL
jgi:hypothetical protein